MNDLKNFFLNLWAITVYSCTRWWPFAKIPISSDLHRDGALIVTLTAKPSRIEKLWLVLESILRQTEKPDGLILYLAREEFANEDVLPESLTRLKKRGLQIVFVESNLKPHNKYYFAMKSFPRANIVTVDDDKIYPANLIANLKKGHEKYPTAICASMTRSLVKEDSKLAPYVKWPVYKFNSKPSHLLVALGVCGVLYPPNALHSDVFDEDRLKQLALYADDLWLKVMALKGNTPVFSVAGSFKETLISISGSNTEQLTTRNIGNGENDIVVGKLFSFYHIEEDFISEERILQDI
ncbi:hypothetical protein [Desertivirga brevis]|uniref:hypothetical protein n=1 Tax=Desertivirga brevis TaxID=2810310 RepID=UPI001A96157A|nr:hypothetical protein [Pedobacter sp. SYSU D00873]